MAQRETLDRPVGGWGRNLTVLQMDRVNMFDEQSRDMENEIKEFRRDCEIEIARLEAEIRAAKAELEIEAEAIRNQYFPACVYRPMTSPELKRACWAEYIAFASTSQGKKVVDLTETRLAEATRAYADIVRTRHIVKFLEAEGYQTWLKLYINKKMGYFDDACEERRVAKEFRDLLQGMGLNVRYVHGPLPSPAMEIPLIKANTGQRDDDDDVVSTGGSSSRGPQTVHDFRAKLRAASVPFKHAEKPSKDKHSQRSKKDGSDESSASEK
ncbi:hypothetical protein KFK09_001402 [Dendrobium nobile]|uniref:Uncharacterized protein n=1 Tax=Dendrobium nobile TaxID=94219 RepID=A0A8T3C9H2_DENNO|nr:hypothetical protein KFK09_001402 [Dendrobium nobile]